MQAYRYNWPAIVIIDLQTQYIIPVLYDKVIIIKKTLNWLQLDFRLQISDFEFWQTLDFGFGLRQLTDFRLWFQARILDFGHTLDFRLWFLDSRFWTDIRRPSSLLKTLKYCGEPPWPRGSVLGLRPPGLEFRILCLEGSVISIISPSSGGSPGPV